MSSVDLTNGHIASREKYNGITGKPKQLLENALVVHFNLALRATN